MNLYEQAQLQSALLEGLGETDDEQRRAQETFLALLQSATQITELAPRLTLAYKGAAKLGKLTSARAAAFSEWVLRAQGVIKDLGRMLATVPDARAELEKRGLSIADMERGLAPASALQGFANPAAAVFIAELAVWAARVGSVAWRGFLAVLGTRAAQSAVTAAIWGGLAYFTADSLNLFGSDMSEERKAREAAVALCKDVNPQATTVDECANEIMKLMDESAKPQLATLLPWLGLAALGGAFAVLWKTRRPDGHA